MKLRKLSDLILSTAVQFESRLLDLLLEDGDLLPDPLGHLAVLHGQAAAGDGTLNEFDQVRTDHLIGYLLVETMIA